MGGSRGVPDFFQSGGEGKENVWGEPGFGGGS